MQFLRRVSLVLTALLLLATPAQAAFQTGDLICETTATTGTGTVNLAGAVANYVTFASQITSGNTVPYQIESGDGKLEAGVGVFTDATPDTLTRVATWSTDGSGAELSLSGTSTICLGPNKGTILTFNNVQAFTSGDGTYTPTAGTAVVKVTCTGEGGGGGGSDDDGGAAVSGLGGGGEGGGTAIIWYDLAELGANAAYSIGDGGGGGGSGTNGTAGTDGDDTTFNPAGTGSTITGAGGDGGDGSGVASTSAMFGLGGSGEGTATNGDINISGSAGRGGATANDGTNAVGAVGGAGGGSFWGPGGGGIILNSSSGAANGANATVPGGGGQGGMSTDLAGTGGAGGSGADGICVVEEFLAQ